MTTLLTQSPKQPPSITWEKLPPDFVLPDDPVDDNLHPQLRVLEVYHLVDGKYQLDSPDENQRFWIESLGLYLGGWIGKKADYEGCWLRWWDSYGNLLLWGSELIELERQRAAQERQRTEQERQRAEQSEAKSIRLAQKLQEIGIDPEEV
jgi:hypothetical protein